MMLGQLAIGAAIGILIGCFFVWLLEKRHQKTIRKLVESRKKIERQRTQAVNDLFAYRANEKPETSVDHRPPSSLPVDEELLQQNMELQSEVANLRTLIARADNVLTAARRKRDEHETEIIRLQALIEAGGGADVIDIRRQEAARRKAGLGGSPSSEVAL